MTKADFFSGPSSYSDFPDPIHLDRDSPQSYGCNC